MAALNLPDIEVKYVTATQVTVNPETRHAAALVNGYSQVEIELIGDEGYNLITDHFALFNSIGVLAKWRILDAIHAAAREAL